MPRERRGRGKRKGGGEVADSELLALDSVYFSDSSASAVLRPDCMLESPGYTGQWDGHLLGCDCGPGSFQSLPGDSNLQPGGNKCQLCQESFLCDQMK